MANFTAGAQEEFSFTQVVEDVSQHGDAQTEALRDRQETLMSLQATLSDVEKEGEMSEQALRSKVRDILILECEVERLELQTQVLHSRCAAISKENTNLQIVVREEEENARTALASFNAYRDKMEGHRLAVLHVASQTEAHKELEDKRALVRMLMQKKEELREDLQNPHGNTVQRAKSDNESLKRQISVVREDIANRRERLQKEAASHTQMKKDIEIQNRRYEAIVKRLHCQLSRAQAAHRQVSEEVFHMERRLAELKGQQESSQDSAVSAP